jgi:hypothetical protein
MTEPTTNPSGKTGRSGRVSGPRQLDHNQACVGCGAGHADPCDRNCPFESGVFSPAVLLRAAARRLLENRSTAGYDIGGALYAAAVDLVDADAAGAVDRAREVLTGFLVCEWGPDAEPIHSQPVHRLGLLSDVADIARSLYAAAARDDDKAASDGPGRGEGESSATVPGTATGIDLHVGDRITILPGQARSARTRTELTTRFAIAVTSIRPELPDAVEVTGLELTSRGAWRAGLPNRAVILDAGSYLPGIRVGDTVRYPSTGETPVVTAIHERPDGTAVADLLFRSGSTGCGYRLTELEHRARPAETPARQPCLRRHDPTLRCARCVEAREPVTTGCAAVLCSNRATNLVVWWPPSSGQQATALCAADTAQHLDRLRETPSRVVELADGTHSLLADGSGTQTATCRHCGHRIVLYLAQLGRTQPWREGEYDETGRCGVAELRHASRVVHEPAVTRAELDYARGSAICGTTGHLHSLADCPARRS